MSNDTVKNNTLEFLKRVDLKGVEVPAFVEALNWLAGLKFPEQPQVAKSGDEEPQEQD
jgi:hypothetical protein